MNKLFDIWCNWAYWILEGNKKQKTIGILLLVAMIILTLY